MTKENRIKLIAAFVVFDLVAMGAWFFTQADNSAQAPAAQAVVKSLAGTDKRAEKVVTSTAPAEAGKEAATEVDTASKVATSERGDPSSTQETPDPNDEPDNTLAGISYRDVDMWEVEDLKLPEKAKGGVLISKIHAKSSFAESQIRPGDIVTRAHHTEVVSFTDLENAVEGRTHTLLDLYRNGKAYQVVLNQPFNPK